MVVTMAMAVTKQKNKKNGWCIRKYAEEIKEGDSQSKMIYLRL